KGVGGYLLTCNGEDKEAIQKLRERKRRPSKPLALMYHDLLILAEDLEVGAADMVALQSSVAPIMLLTLKADPLSAIPFGEIAPGLSRVGAMLPYTPLYDLLLRQFGRPIVATSGNLSGSPIIYENDKAVEYLSPIADLILGNNRDIVAPQDDSVLIHTPMQRQPIVMRRSRGLAPNTLQQIGEATLLATGASLKSSFAYAANRNVYLSQYLGDTENYESQRSYERVLQHFLQLFGKQPEAIACDLHPAYFSTQKAEALAKAWEAPLVKVQHHVAHFYALLGEHQLLDDPLPTLGFIWDGTGLGDDGQIWGGECFIYENGLVHRYNHIDYFDFILGDKMPKEPRISALAIAHTLPEAQSLLTSLFTDAEWGIYNKLLRQGNHLQSSSVGRLFDAAAAMLLDMGRQTYEGEAAMRLEAQAHHYFRQNFPKRELSYLYERPMPAHLPRFLLQQLLKGKAEGVETPVLAARFHLTLADYVGRVAEQAAVERLGFSGGVFQNAWLVDLIQRFWKDRFELYFHSSMPPNDENVAFGQLMYLYHRQS
ncbi:MAG TPA: Sua5/YciO/YrdC/YwlC family protein, partial [Phaeodactylibacter sp.]|nr:Sua5/YciO/YrdC/YwlC family protein [Phaeodactylibacter sp.]